MGEFPLSEPETRALAGYTEVLYPALVLAFRTQGQVIYRRFRDYEVPGAEELCRRFAQASGYADQAHMCRESRRITGYAPGELYRLMQSEERFWAYRLWAFGVGAPLE